MFESVHLASVIEEFLRSAAAPLISDNQFLVANLHSILSNLAMGSSSSSSTTAATNKQATRT